LYELIENKILCWFICLWIFYVWSLFIREHLYKEKFLNEKCYSNFGPPCILSKWCFKMNWRLFFSQINHLKTVDQLKLFRWLLRMEFDQCTCHEKRYQSVVVWKQNNAKGNKNSKQLTFFLVSTTMPFSLSWSYENMFLWNFDSCEFFIVLFDVIMRV
jgi:hypothetical protein